MEVRNLLPAMITGIGNAAKAAVLKTFLCDDFRDSAHKGGDFLGAGLAGKVIDADISTFGYDKDMRRGLRRDIAKRQNMVIFIDSGVWNLTPQDFGKNVVLIVHGDFPFSSRVHVVYIVRMMLTMLKAKIHRATVTQADLHYNGSITVDTDLLAAAGILAHEQVDVLNITNGHRFTTYAIEGEAGSGVIGINGAAAHLAGPGDLVIICSYAQMDAPAAKAHKPVVILVDGENKVAP